MISGLPLFPHIQQGSMNQDLSSMAKKPKWVKVFAPVHCQEVKDATGHESFTLLRLPEMSENGGVYIEQGYQGGLRFAQEALGQIGAYHGVVNALEFMNENTGYDNVAWLQKNNEAGKGFVAGLQGSGIKPVIHNASVANPRVDLLIYLKDSIASCLSAGGYFGTHCYGPRTLLDQAELYVECYKTQVNELRRLGVNIAWGQVLVTEFGYDYLGSYRNAQGQNDSGAWRKIGISTSELQAQFLIYAQNLAALGVGGAFMYNFFGYENQRDYELNPYITQWYKDALASFVPPNPPQPPNPEYVRISLGSGYTSAYLRKTASEVTRIGTINKGERVRVLGKEGNYYKVEIQAYIPINLTAPD